MRKLFTLIELIVVIAVLGILAAIIIPNISSFQEEANTTAIKSNVRSLQTGVDMYSMNNYGSVPTLGGSPTEYEPKPIDFDSMHPDYTRDLPETPGVKYWVDGWGKVWASSVDAPKKVELNSTTLNWETVPEADMYKVYKVLNPTNTASLLNTDTKLVFYKEASKNEYTGFSVDDENAQYAVSALDNKKFESAAAGSNYMGYDEIVEQSKNVEPIVPVEPSVSKGEYIILEIYDHYGGNGATITEMKVYDKNNNVLSYTPSNVYDSATNGLPSYWNALGWDKGNINDNNFSYVGNYPSGYDSTFLVNWDSTANSGKWSRVSYKLPSSIEIGKVEIWAGSPEYRIPHYIDIYVAETYTYSTNISQRNNDGLVHFNKLNFVGNENTVSKYTVSPK